MEEKNSTLFVRIADNKQQGNLNTVYEIASYMYFEYVVFIKLISGDLNCIIIDLTMDALLPIEYLIYSKKVWVEYEQ